MTVVEIGDHRSEAERHPAPGFAGQMDSHPPGASAETVALRPVQIRHPRAIGVVRRMLADRRGIHGDIALGWHSDAHDGHRIGELVADLGRDRAAGHRLDEDAAGETVDQWSVNSRRTSGDSLPARDRCSRRAGRAPGGWCPGCGCRRSRRGPPTCIAEVGIVMVEPHDKQNPDDQYGAADQQCPGPVRPGWAGRRHVGPGLFAPEEPSAEGGSSG